MTNYLNTAVASNGSACFMAMAELEQYMSDAQQKTLIASKDIIALSPGMITGQINLAHSQAEDQMNSAMWAGIGQFAQGGVSLASAGYGEFFAGNNAYNETMEAGTTKEVTVETENLSNKMNTGEAASLEGEVQGGAPRSSEIEEESQVKAAESKAAETTDEQKEVTAKKDVQKAAGQKNLTEEERVNNLKERAEQARLNAVTKWCNTYAPNLGLVVAAGPTIGKGSYDRDATLQQGLSTAAGQVLQTIQSAQSAQSALAQAYEKGFDSAASVLASIIGNLRG